MAKKKWKKTLKKVGKAAALAGALYGAAKLGKRAKSKAVEATDDAGINVKHFAPDDYNYTPKKHVLPHTIGPITLAAKGGRIGKKGGGRIGKQFGGGLGRTARRDMRSGYYPNDMGMRGGPMYKKGGRVKSRGIAKRGGGAEIK